MKPIKLKNMKRTNCWKPAGPVWYQHNRDRMLLGEKKRIMSKKEAKEHGRLEYEEDHGMHSDIGRGDKIHHFCEECDAWVD